MEQNKIDPIRIAIDAHTVGTQHAGNVTFITEMIEHLAAIDHINQYTLYMSEESAIREYTDRWPNFRVRRFPHNSRLLRFFFSFPRLIKQEPVDIFFCQFNAPPGLKCKIVTVIHDVSFLRVPETFPLRMRTQMVIMTKRTALRSSHLITPSEYSRLDLIAAYNLPDDKVSTVHLAAPKWYAPVSDPSELARIREKYGLDDEYILCVGTIQPRKNLVRLIEAYSSLLKRGVEMPRLVLTGRIAWLSGDSVTAAAVNGIKDRVKFTGFVPDEDMPALYSAATAFVYPSYFEGFGLPPLEAMQCGTPVIVGDRTSLPEVVGDAALLVDPFDVNAIAAALERVVTDEALREDLRRKGLEQARKFSWEKAARETFEIFRRVHNSK